MEKVDDTEHWQPAQLIPATGIGGLAGQERRRSDEKWRAGRMAKAGKKLVDTEIPESRVSRQDTAT